MTISINAARLTELKATGDQNTPFVGWNNRAVTAANTLGGTAVLADGARENAILGGTYSYWKPNVTTTTANFQVVFTASRIITLVGIAAHNFGTRGCDVYCEKSEDSGASWISAGATFVTPTDNTPIVFRLRTDATATTHWRIRLANLTAGADVYAGVIFFGDELLMPSRFFGGFSPAIVPTEVQLQSNVSVGGNLLGSQVIGQGSTLSATFRHVLPGSVRNVIFRNFMNHFNQGKGFFFGWRPDRHPEDVYYCWRDGETIRPANMGVLEYLEFSMNMRVYEE